MSGYLFIAVTLIGISAGLAVYELACAWCGAKRSAANVSLPFSSDDEAVSFSRADKAKVAVKALLERVSVAIAAFAPMTHAEAGSTKECLRRAGVNVEPETWRAFVVLAMIAMAATCVLACSLLSVPSIWMIAVAVGAAVVGRYAAKRFLLSRQRDRRQAVEASLPDAMELLAVALAAGSPIEQCFREVSASLKGPISEELRLVDQEVNLLGHSRSEALEHFAQRCKSHEVTSFVGQITQSIDQGSCVSEGLAAQALLAREQAQAVALERIRKMPTKLDIILSACFLPPTVILVLVPTVVKLLAFLNEGMA